MPQKTMDTVLSFFYLQKFVFFVIMIYLIAVFCSGKEEAGGLSEDGVGGLPFSDADFKPEDIKLDASCDFGNGDYHIYF